MTREQQLEKEIADKKAELEALKKNRSLRDNAVKPLEEYTTEEKCEWFDGNYRSAEDTLKKKESGEYHEDNDDAHYTWESMMELLARNSRDFWNYYNSL